MWRACIVQKLFVFLMMTSGGFVGSAGAATTFSLSVEPDTVAQGGSFVLELGANLDNDVLLSLDPVVEFDGARLNFAGYQISGTLTEGFMVFASLSDPAISLLQGGDLVLPPVQTALRAHFDVLPAAALGTTTVRMRGYAGLDIAGDASFDFSREVLVTAVPEPSAWLLLLIGIGLVLVRGLSCSVSCFSSTRPLSSPACGSRRESIWRR